MNRPIIIKMPADPINAMPVRLFVSGLAARSGFDIEAIEDIKTLVSEICVLLLSSVAEGELIFEINSERGIHISAHVLNAVYGETDDDSIAEFSRMIITSLADKSDIKENEDGRITRITIDFATGD